MKVSSYIGLTNQKQYVTSFDCCPIIFKRMTINDNEDYQKRNKGEITPYDRYGWAGIYDEINKKTNDDYIAFALHDSYLNYVGYESKDISCVYETIDGLSEDLLKKTDETLIQLLPQYDVILPKQKILQNVNVDRWIQYNYGPFYETFKKIKGAFEKIHPEYSEEIDGYLQDCKYDSTPIFLMKASIYGNFCDFFYTTLSKINIKLLKCIERSQILSKILTSATIRLFINHINKQDTIRTLDVPEIVVKKTSKGRIKIFDTHHKDFCRIDNPVILDVCSGIQYQNPEMESNATGDNISSRWKLYSELTTQYWAWKNKDLDYYGFCHYRRFFSFGYEVTPDIYGNILVQSYYPQLSKDMGYDNDIESIIPQYDIILPKPFIVTKAGFKNVYDQYEKAEMLDKRDLDLTIEVIKEKYPSYVDAAKSSLFGNVFYPCNMFIMRKDIFDEYCNWLFDILFELEKQIDFSKKSNESLRTLGHIGERLLGVFIDYQKQHKNHVIKELPKYQINDMSTDHLLKPAFSNNNVPIIFSTNNQFSLFIASTIQSIVKSSTSSNNYDLFVLFTNLSEPSKEMIKSSIKGHDNFRVRFVDLALVTSKYNLKPNAHITVETFYRLFAPDIFKEYKKALYLDGDITVLSDVAELFNTDIGNNLIGGVPDVDFIGQYNGFNEMTRKYADSVLQLTDPYKYVQAGVLILNLEQMRIQFPCHELVEYGNNKFFKYGDQDILNIKCQGHIEYLDLSWNVLHACDGVRIQIVRMYTPGYLADAYFESRKHPKIIHYAGYLKPWDNPTIDFADVYWDSIRNSPPYELILNRFIKQNNSNILGDTATASARPRGRLDNILEIVVNKAKALLKKIRDP